MDNDHRNSEIEGKESRTKSLMGSFKGSFKMAESLLVPGSNKKVVNLEIPGIKLADKDKHRKQEVCQICFVGFSTLTRQHHCRICANAVCSSCSNSSINKERQILLLCRACDVCAYKYSNTDRETTKSNIQFQLQGAAMLFVQSRNALEQQLKKVNEEANDIEAAEKAIEASQRKLKELQKQIEEVKRAKQSYEKEIATIQGQ